MANKVIRFLGLPEKYHGLPTEWMLMAVFLVAVCFTGCGGCDCNCLNVDVKPTHKTGSITMTVNNLTALGNPDRTEVIAVNYAGAVTSSNKDYGDASFSRSKNYEVTAATVNPSPTYERVNLRPGSWSITVSAGSWSKSQNVSLGEGKSLSLTFTYGQ